MKESRQIQPQRRQEKRSWMSPSLVRSQRRSMSAVLPLLVVLIAKYLWWQRPSWISTVRMPGSVFPKVGFHGFRGPRRSGSNFRKRPSIAIHFWHHLVDRNLGIRGIQPFFDAFLIRQLGAFNARKHRKFVALIHFNIIIRCILNQHSQSVIN